MAKNGPNEEQLAALENFRKARGRTWKSKLIHAWYTGADAELFDGSLLRQIRNTFGPTWLAAYRAPEPSTQNVEPSFLEQICYKKSASGEGRPTQRDEFYDLKPGEVIRWNNRRLLIEKTTSNEQNRHSVYIARELNRDGVVMARRNPSGFDNCSLSTGKVEKLGTMGPDGCFGRDREPGLTR